MTANANFWDKIAESYAAKPVDNPDAFDRKIAITRDRMTPGQTVLDIGCGTGSLLLRLASTGATLHGLDVSPEMVRIAREKASAAAAENVTFHVGAFDQTFTTFGPGSLSGICAYSILHLVDDYDAALQQIYDTLEPGGFFVSSTVCLGGSWVPWGAILTVMRWIGKAPPVTCVRRRDLIAAMTRVGFVDIDQPDVGAGNTIAFVTARRPV